MANQKHLDQLKQGVKTWNQWQKEHLHIQVDLSNADLSEAFLYEADLRGADLSDADLSNADLSEANLSDDLGADNFDVNDLCAVGPPLLPRKADLRRANLYKANLYKANLDGANLRRANLHRANLRRANLDGVNLHKANLSFTNLRFANLRRADLSGADLSQAIVGGTTFGDVDLSTVKGLETVKHIAPSTIGIDTIYHSQGNIPEVFLKGAGADDTFITYIRKLERNRGMWSAKKGRGEKRQRQGH